MDGAYTWEVLATLAGAAAAGTLLTSLGKRLLNLNGKRVELGCIVLTAALYTAALVVQGARGAAIPLAVLNGLVAGAAAIGINRLGAPDGGK